MDFVPSSLHIDACASSPSSLALHVRPADVGVISLDGYGLACVWDTKTCQCLLRSSTGLAFLSASLWLSSGVLAVEVQLRSKDQSLCPAGRLAVLNPSLQLLSELNPSQILPIIQVYASGANAANLYLQSWANLSVVKA